MINYMLHLLNERLDLALKERRAHNRLRGGSTKTKNGGQRIRHLQWQRMQEVISRWYSMILMVLSQVKRLGLNSWSIFTQTFASKSWSCAPIHRGIYFKKEAKHLWLWPLSTFKNQLYSSSCICFKYPIVIYNCENGIIINLKSYLYQGASHREFLLQKTHPRIPRIDGIWVPKVLQWSWKMILSSMILDPIQCRLEGYFPCRFWAPKKSLFEENHLGQEIRSKYKECRHL